MAAYALLIGIKDGKKHLVIDGSPVEVRKLFKNSDGEGFEQLDVIESGVGRSRSRKFLKKQAEVIAKKQAKKAAKESE
jgi:hypothetical protein